MKWSAPHPYPTTRNWTHEQGGRWAGGWEKRIPRIRDSLFQHVNKKKGCPEQTWENPSNMNVLYKSFSRRQKHEQVLKFPTHILLAQSGHVTAHKWFDAAWGPAAEEEGVELSFHRSSGTSPADWALPFSPRPGRGVQGPARGPLAPGVHAFHALCWRGPQSAQQQVLCSAGLPSAASPTNLVTQDP